jgi:transcription elongation factor GreB
VARLAGFEPTTPWFVAKYSIQLSYSRTQKRNYSKLLRKGKCLQQLLADEPATGHKIGKKPCQIVASGVEFALGRLHSGCADRVRLLIDSINAVVGIMNKAFVKESGDDADDDLDIAQPDVPAGAKNYITPSGHKRLRDELLHLIDQERPEVVKLVSWAASNGDRSENGDYIYGKRRLREIDRRIRFLTRRLDLAEVVDSSKQENLDQVFFGAAVDYAAADGETHTVTIVGIDEVDLDQGRVSWVSPIARALLKARIGEVVTLHTPAGPEQIDVLDVRYPPAVA